MERTLTEKGPSCEPKKLYVVKIKKRQYEDHYIPSHHDADALDVARIKLLGIFLLLAPVGGREVAPWYKELLFGDFWADFDIGGGPGVKVVFVGYGRLLSAIFWIAGQ